MPKLKPDIQRARRERILDAAEICFARSGFHRCSMQDICREAGISAGALYVYFESKEALIAGIAERDRAKLSAQLADVAKAPDLLAALSRLADHYAIEEPHYKRVLCIEIGCESTRNGTVGEIYRAFDDGLREQFVTLFETAKAEGRIAPAADCRMLAEVLSVIGDGLFWRRAVDPRFDAAAVMPTVLALLTPLINPVPAAKPLPNRATDSETDR